MEKVEEYLFAQTRDRDRFPASQEEGALYTPFFAARERVAAGRCH